MGKKHDFYQKLGLKWTRVIKQPSFFADCLQQCWGQCRGPTHDPHKGCDRPKNGQKMTILSQIWGSFPPPPQGPQYLTRMAPVGSKFSLILPLESKGIELTCFCSQRVKLSCFSQKTAILSQIWGCFPPPPRAPNNWPGWPLWAPNFP